jgi:CHAT domain
MTEFGLNIRVLASEQAQATELGSADPVTPTVDLDYDPLRQRTLQVLTDGLSRRRRIVSRKQLEQQGQHLLVTSDEVKLLGEHLFATLFVGEIANTFWRMLDDVGQEKPHQQLTVRLSFEDRATTLAEWPWEYLRAPETETRPGFYLSTEVNLILSRYLPLSEGSSSPLPQAGPLRVLLLVSRPSDLGMENVDVGQLEATIKNAGQVHVKTVPMEDATREGVEEAIREDAPHVLHVVGEGGPSFATEPVIALVDDKGETDWVPESIFTSLVAPPERSPAVIVLHLWQPEEGGPERSPVLKDLNFEPLGPALVRARVPAVVAMRHALTGQRAAEFNNKFYTALASGETVEAAVRAARVRLRRIRDEPFPWAFGTPVLYRHKIEGLILVEEQVQPDAPKARSSQVSSTTNGASTAETRVAPAPRTPTVTGEGRDIGAIEDRAVALVSAGRERLTSMELDPATRAEMRRRLLKLQTHLQGLEPECHAGYLTEMTAPEDEPAWQELLDVIVEAAFDMGPGQ